MTWLTANAGTILVLVILVVLVGLVIRKMIMDRRRGITACDSCVSADSCSIHAAGKDHAAVAARDESIGRATVYRALHRFVEKGKAVCVPVYDGADRYDETLLPHSHAKCTKCGGVTDVFIRGTLPEIENACGFAVEGGAVLYYGCCAACRESK